MNIVHCFFKDKEIRFVDGSPVANDIAAVLGYADPAKTISTKVSKKNKGVADLVTPGGIQSVAVLKEAGIYQLIFSSKLGSAEEFQDWVFEDVLPSIRKTGSYSIASQPTLEPIDIFNLDDRTYSLLHAWGLYGHKENALEIWGKLFWAFPHPDEFATLDNRLKKMPMAAIRHVVQKQILAADPILQEYVDQFVPDPFDIEDAALAQQFQAQLDRTQLAPGENNLQLAQID